MSGQEWVAVIGAIGAACCAVLVGVAQLVVAVRSSQKVTRVESMVNGHTRALQSLASTAFERGVAAVAKPLYPGTLSGGQFVGVRPPGAPRINRPTDRHGNELRWPL